VRVPERGFFAELGRSEYAMRSIRLALTLLLSLGAVALADDQSDRQQLMGSWELQSPSENTPAASWTFSATGNSMHVKQLDGGSEVADFACGTKGADCEVKTGGKKVTVSLWFNGPSLVEMETKGPEVVKRRFKILPQGAVMEMEVIPIVPSGKTQTFEFKRANSLPGK
jgi:hypothetical protein